MPGVTTERRDATLIIHLDDGRANAVTRDFCAAITAAIREAEADPAIKAVVLHGRPGRFSGGFDLGVMGGDDPQAIADLAADGAMLVHTLYSAKVPVVAAVTGHAIAVGAMIVLGCDLRVGADLDVKIGMSEHAIGMALPQWALTILAERLDRGMLQRSVMNAEMYAPAEAVKAGYLDVVVPAERVLGEALEAADRLGSQLELRARAATLTRFRGPMLEALAAQAAEFRNGGTLAV